jgi:hypothetical protein
LETYGILFSAVVTRGMESFGATQVEAMGRRNIPEYN